ncbi:GNAT family N-acetyltransferase [Parvularcula sp. ZS-1/3]|uniref:GNAT family N-acetyltransferase n=1 Tax=Parvularcula mediterranea TaxID=2732508 RepID=A0A7Y3RLP5_9PROT|nr:GNAT family N-acetyltransferase [Parvularcula mediterranea]NNU15836.1 GNAT family N-acetyltransferase [Parvularcula mediterranea]
MTKFRPMRPSDRSSIIAMLDANIPEAFAPGEREVFLSFLDAIGERYRVFEEAGEVLAAYALSPDDETGEARIQWFMAHPAAHGRGLGRAMMAEAMTGAQAMGARCIHIAASHVSEGFYARCGAETVQRKRDGWAPRMHRVDMELKL